MNKVNHSLSVFICILLMSLCVQPILAKDQPNKDNTYLVVARNQLSIAFDQYNDGDITASKKSLSKASDWLNKAVAHSKYDKIKKETEKLSVEIDEFRQKLSHSSEQNDMIRFWHQATSLITRDSEQLVHSYIKSSNNNRILKHLLDAKMHFYLAEHDIFVSHDLKDAVQELNGSLKYLAQADVLARPKLDALINDLIKDINTLKHLAELRKESWKDDNLIDSLDKAINNVTNAKLIATPPIKIRLKSIENNINQLKLDVQKMNVKNRYDSIMADFIRAIQNI